MRLSEEGGKDEVSLVLPSCDDVLTQSECSVWSYKAGLTAQEPAC